MRTRTRLVQSLLAIGALLFFATAPALCGATFQPQILYSFTHNDLPITGLILGPDGNFYGSDETGGDVGNGSVFRMTPGGLLTNLVSFDWFITGADPRELMFGPDGNLYGYASEGGTFQDGTLFKVATNGVMTTLVAFNETNGAGPAGRMVLGNDGDLYGVTGTGGTSGAGTVFRLRLDGALTTVVNFNYANGAWPEAGLILGKDGNFYGTTSYGAGTVFKMTPEGTLTTLAHLDGGSVGPLIFGNDGQLYGTTQTFGGTVGSVFKVSTRGKLTILVNFHYTNGAEPMAGLFLAPDGNLYGTTQDAGADTDSAYPFASGTIFEIIAGKTFTTLFNYAENDQGFGPYGGRTYANFTLGPEGSLYSTSLNGTNAISSGTVFRLDLPPTVTSEPQSRFKAEGTMVSFSVAAVGTQPFSYQWLKNGTALSDGTNIFGSQSNVINLSNLQASDAGDYSVTITNVAGNVMSSAAELTVLQHGHSAVQALAANVPNPSGQTNLSGTGTLPLIATPPVNVLTLEGSPNYSYIVQYTADFLHGPWLILSTNVANTNGTCVVIDPFPTDSQRFYRCFAQ